MRRRRFKLRRISAWELLQARLSARLEADEAAQGLVFNAEVVARAARRFGRPAFHSAQEVLRALPEEEIYRLTAQYFAQNEPAEECGTNQSFDRRRFEELRS